ncbi:PEP-CTERM sorting domain-containing protein [Desulfosediminicola flagellatus]|uniref:PEP-CTERM sorting domain-containing protein n=1 Tax=Desulfosediminicola flagellatus TaxID=2569541 RepID=UPI001E3DA178|nr:PEP-CTERM sorting domain-containing protein [Desulfosediminicola flagellatus]
MKNFGILTIIFINLFLLSFSTYGATVYQNPFIPVIYWNDEGESDVAGAWSSNADDPDFIRQQVADDFHFSDSTLVSEIGWLGTFTDVYVQDSYTNGFNIRFYNDNSGLPDSTPLYDIEVNSLTGAAVGDPHIINNHERFSYSLLLNTPILFDPGVYWISIISNTNLTFAWTWSGWDTDEYLVVRNHLDGGAWRAVTNTNNQDLVFALGNPLDEGWDRAVPEPTTMLLFGTGIAGLAAVGRRRK